MIQTHLLHAGSFVNGEELLGNGRVTHEVHSPYMGHLVGKIDYATLADLENGIATAHDVFHRTMKKMPAYQRANILRRTADLLQEHSEEFAQTLALEAGKPLRDGRAEVSRGIQILHFAAEEAKQLAGTLLPMDAAIGGENRLGMVRRDPIGVVVAITPFNFPLNLVLHKLAPAIAAGNTVVLKPAEKTPLTAIKLAKLFAAAGLPHGALNVLMGTGVDLGKPLVTDPRVKKITFTGSSAVGLQIKAMADLKKVTLELGSNAPNIIFADANLDAAASGLVRGSFAFAGQVCISAQRIYVQMDVYQAFIQSFVPLVEKLQVGDPLEEATDLGPMINEREACRAEQWVEEAIAAGATLLTGGKREGSVLYPTVLTDVTADMRVVCQEVFAPIVSIIPFATEEEVIRLANDSDYGLQAGVFTRDINRAMRLADALETGGVWINEVSTYRQDNYPYGGVKLSGVGREGVKYALEDMTELKFIGMKLE